jgi:hypothetical protein
MANHVLNALEAALDRAVEAAADAQAARDEARARAGLTKAPPAFFTAAAMIAEMVAAEDRHRAETREIVAAAICEARYRYDPTYKPDAMHRALIELAASFRDEAKRAAATASNVVPLATAREISAAAKKRRSET